MIIRHLHLAHNPHPLPKRFFLSILLQTIKQKLSLSKRNHKTTRMNNRNDVDYMDDVEYPSDMEESLFESIEAESIDE